MLLIYKPQYSLGRKRSAQRHYKKRKNTTPTIYALRKEYSFPFFTAFYGLRKKVKRNIVFTPFILADSVKDKLIYL